MLKRTVSRVMLSVLIIGIFGSAFNLKLALSSEIRSQNIAPDFTLTDISGEIFCLYNCSARVVLIEFFATWCSPCVSQIPALRNLYGNYSRDQLEIISISSESEVVLLDFAEEHEIEWIVARDTIDLSSQYDVWGVPTSFIIDVQRFIRHEHIGLTDESTFRSEIESLLPLTIYVDDDNTAGPWDGTPEHPYQNITSGLEHALAGDTIFVRNGTYYENVVVNKSVSLIGQAKTTTAIITEASNSTVYVSASNVTLRGFEIRNSEISGKPWGWGIILNHSSNSVVDGNIVKAPYAIRVEEGSGNNISYNEVIGLPYCCVIIGLKLANSNNTVVTGNYLSFDCHITFTMYNSNHNHISANYISGHFAPFRFYLEKSNNNLIIGNTLWNCAMPGYGHIHFTESYDNLLYHNNFMVDWGSVRMSFDDASMNNTWHNSCEGNYWSDYNGTDSDGDGIGDIPHIIDENNTDHYPLMNPYWNPADVNHDLKVDIYDVVLACGAYGSTPSDPHWNCHCDITEPYDAIDIYDIVVLCNEYGKEYNP